MRYTNNCSPGAKAIGRFAMRPINRQPNVHMILHIDLNKNELRDDVYDNILPWYDTSSYNIIHGDTHQPYCL